MCGTGTKPKQQAYVCINNCMYLWSRRLPNTQGWIKRTRRQLRQMAHLPTLQQYTNPACFERTTPPPNGGGVATRRGRNGVGEIRQLAALSSPDLKQKRNALQCLCSARRNLTTQETAFVQARASRKKKKNTPPSYCSKLRCRYVSQHDTSLDTHT